MDLSQDRLILPQTKNGDGRVVYLSDGAQALLRSLTHGQVTSLVENLFAGITRNQLTHPELLELEKPFQDYFAISERQNPKVVGVPKHSELEPDCGLAQRDGDSSNVMPASLRYADGIQGRS
jgi:hypothetical protein